MMRKIILNLAMSLDGYISDENGGFDWILGDGDKRLDTEKAFDFNEFLIDVDTVVMGRKAYEDCGINDVKGRKVIVATSQKMIDYENVEFVNRDICGYIRDLQQKNGKSIWLFGGSTLTDCFIKADLIDEYIVGIIPVVLGKGRPLFLGNNPLVKLHLEEYTLQEGVAILRYSRRK